MATTSPGDTTKLIINEKWEFGVGVTADLATFILKDILSLHLNRIKTRRAIKAGPSLTYGTGNHDCEVVIEADTGTLGTILGWNTRTANGKMTIQNIELTATALDATTKIIKFKGIIADIVINGTGNDGRLQATVKIDITSDVPTVT